MSQHSSIAITALALLLGVGCVTVSNQRSALRAYANGDCHAILESTNSQLIEKLSDKNDYLAALNGFCLELAGATERAVEQYEALYKADISTETKGLSNLRLHQLNRLEQLGLTREQYADRVKEQAKAYFDQGKPNLIPIHRVNPYYPSNLSNARIEGWSAIAAELTPDGSVSGAEPIDSDPPFLFDLAAMAAFKQWRYPPSTEAEPRFLNVKLQFKLH
jgi:TonB family protein